MLTRLDCQKPFKIVAYALKAKQEPGEQNKQRNRVRQPFSKIIQVNAILRVVSGIQEPVEFSHRVIRAKVKVREEVHEP